MITVNYAYARYSTSTDPVASAAHLAADWVRYDNGKTKYWEIGNEDNGNWEASYRIDLARNHDNQPEFISGSLYGGHFKVFADSMRKAAQETGKTIYIGAQLLEQPSSNAYNDIDRNWNTGVFSQASSSNDFYIFHSYYTPYQENSSAEVILNSAITNTAAMMNWYNTTISSNGAAIKPLALTEWNINAEGSMQKVSYINGMHSAIMLGELLKNKYGMSSRWDMANAWANGNDHGMFNNGDEPGVTKWNARPAFYYMYYFNKMVGDRIIASTVTGSTDILSYASSYTSGETGIILVNKGISAQLVTVTLKNALKGSRYYWYTLTGGTDNGEFSRKVYVNNSGPDQVSGGPSNYAGLKAYSSATTNGINVNMPSRSVVYVVVGK